MVVGKKAPLVVSYEYCSLLTDLGWCCAGGHLGAINGGHFLINPFLGICYVISYVSESDRKVIGRFRIARQARRH